MPSRECDIQTMSGRVLVFYLVLLLARRLNKWFLHDLERPARMPMSGVLATSSTHVSSFGLVNLYAEKRQGDAVDSREKKSSPAYAIESSIVCYQTTGARICCKYERWEDSRCCLAEGEEQCESMSHDQ